MHLHYAYCVPSYGPDSPDNIRTATDYADLAVQLSDDLARDATALGDVIYSCGEAADKARETGDTINELDALREYLRENRRAHELYTLSQNLSAGDAPLYQDYPELWEKRVEKLIVDNFPLSFAHNCVINVWDCTENACAPEDS